MEQEIGNPLKNESSDDGTLPEVNTVYRQIDPVANQRYLASAVAKKVTDEAVFEALKNSNADRLIVLLRERYALEREEGVFACGENASE